MARKTRSKDGQAAKRPRLTYFYLNGDLHRKLAINRGKDALTAWNYPGGKRSVYSYTDVLKRHEKAFTTQQVMKMLNRGRSTIELALVRGMIEPPQHTYSLDENRRMFQYMWSEKDIMAMHEYLASIHWGRPRRDGTITPKYLPTPRELRAMIHDEEILYVKQGDTFIPTWRAKDI